MEEGVGAMLQSACDGPGGTEYEYGLKWMSDALTSAKIFGSFFIIATASVDGVEYSCSLIHLTVS